MTRHRPSQPLAGAIAAGLVFVAVLAPLGVTAVVLTAAPLVAGGLAIVVADRLWRRPGG